MAKRKSGRDVHGIVLLDKRLGVSSNQALQEVKRLFNANKAGHTGALDPLATGLLPLCFGEATKVSALMLDDDKRYLVTIQLGVMTDTGDSEGKVIAEMPVPPLEKRRLLECLTEFVGEIEQVPPMYSALKYQGQKLYELARAGKTVERQARRIKIYQLQLVAADFERGSLTLDVYCSKGTYIRSLAEDIGHRLGSCASVTMLRRTAAGMFDIGQAHTLEGLQAMDSEQLQQVLIALDQPLLGMPEIALTAEQAERVRQGQRIRVAEAAAERVRIYSPECFLGLGEISMDGKLAPKKLFHLDSQTV
ncbi:tRNA pseudouridine(55) synthase TruB [Methylomonas sp. HW2-6]|uniref:tRNA pseudouridine(55) synthase TruB n=1 Tax=Methylomonas sp. HW2-6 TaxID=3376687 RepID=UPI004042C791